MSRDSTTLDDLYGVGAEGAERDKLREALRELVECEDLQKVLDRADEQSTHSYPDCDCEVCNAKAMLAAARAALAGTTTPSTTINEAGGALGHRVVDQPHDVGKDGRPIVQTPTSPASPQDDALIAVLEGYANINWRDPDVQDIDCGRAAARLRELVKERGTLLCAGTTQNPQWTPLGETIVRLESDLAAAESRAKALHEALRQHVILCGHSEAPGRCFVCGNIWEVLDEDHAEGCLAAPEGSA